MATKPEIPTPTRPAEFWRGILLGADRRFRRRARAILPISTGALLLALAACSPLTPSPSQPASVVPSNPDGLPAGQPTRIDLGVAISADNLVVTLRFIGGPELPLDNPCFTDYVGWARPADDVLEVAVVLLKARDAGESTPPACPAVGVERSVEVTLEEPYAGAIARDLPYGTDIQIERGSSELADCSLTGHVDYPHHAPELENQLPSVVAGRELMVWSVSGWCWVQLFMGPDGLANVGAIASAESLDVETIQYAQERRTGPDDPPNFIHAMTYPADQETTDFAVQLFFESIGLVDPDTFDLSSLETTTLGGKQVRLAPEGLLQPSENDRGIAYFYDSGDYLFAITANDVAWAAEVLSQLP